MTTAYDNGAMPTINGENGPYPLKGGMGLRKGHYGRNAAVSLLAYLRGAALDVARMPLRYTASDNARMLNIADAFGFAEEYIAAFDADGDCALDLVELEAALGSRELAESHLRVLDFGRSGCVGPEALCAFLLFQDDAVCQLLGAVRAFVNQGLMPTEALAQAEGLVADSQALLAAQALDTETSGADGRVSPLDRLVADLAVASLPNVTGVLLEQIHASLNLAVEYQRFKERQNP